MESPPDTKPPQSGPVAIPAAIAAMIPALPASPDAPTLPPAATETVEQIKDAGTKAVNTVKSAAEDATKYMEKAATIDASEAAIKYPIYLIAPSTFSYLFSILIIFLLFGIYLISIGAVAAFQNKFFPNIYMFWEFITTGNTKQYQDEFETYMQNVMLTAQNEGAKINLATSESFTGSRPGRPGIIHEYLGHLQDLSSWLSYEFTKIRDLWDHFLLNNVIRGNTIYVARR